MNKFRGIRVDNGKWAYGYYVKIDDGHYITDGEDYAIECMGGKLLPEFIEVIPETVGQQISLKDKKGVEIYERDIVVHYNPVLDECYEDRMKYKTEVTMFNLQIMHPERRIRLEIIGTVHDDPELLPKTQAAT